MHNMGTKYRERIYSIKKIIWTFFFQLKTHWNYTFTQECLRTMEDNQILILFLYMPYITLVVAHMYLYIVKRFFKCYLFLKKKKYEKKSNHCLIFIKHLKHVIFEEKSFVKDFLCSIIMWKSCWCFGQIWWQYANIFDSTKYWTKYHLAYQVLPVRFKVAGYLPQTLFTCLFLHDDDEDVENDDDNDDSKV